MRFSVSYSGPAPYACTMKAVRAAVLFSTTTAGFEGDCLPPLLALPEPSGPLSSAAGAAQANNDGEGHGPSSEHHTNHFTPSRLCGNLPHLHWLSSLAVV